MRSTMRRAALYLQRMLTLPRMVLFYCDLPHYKKISGTPSHHVRVESISQIQELKPEDLQRIVEFWNPAVTQRQIYERFEKGATLWLAFSANQLAGFGWTITGRTIAPHYFSLGSNDVHLFDFLVFPEYRGRGVNPALVSHILRQMVIEERSRAYIEAAEWNLPQLASLSKTGFQVMGSARMLTLFRRSLVQWSPSPTRIRNTSGSISPECPKNADRSRTKVVV